MGKACIIHIGHASAASAPVAFSSHPREDER